MDYNFAVEGDGKNPDYHCDSARKNVDDDVSLMKHISLCLFFLSTNGASTTDSKN
ncbi:hypothetical protein WSM22_10600 [Cytophagales bacterium WSM2-2]|nr:hypothetical protein WSM22_10600 [Cytophagales bacterium WSM2-2]